jgi:hypothetical protein
VSIGPFLDSADGVTAETGLTITQPDIRLKKNGGAWAQKNAAQTLSHEENGWYEISLDTTDTNTLGNLLIAVNESGALPVWREFQVVTANVWDSLFSTDKLQVHVDEMTNGIITAAAIATGAVDADALAADAAAEIADAVWDEDATAHQTQGTFGQGLGDSGAGGVSIRDLIGTPNFDLSTDIANIPTASENATELLDQADGVETGLTLREWCRIVGASTAGKLSGAGTGTETIRNAVADSKNRLVATVDGDGNRTAITYDLT